MWIQAQGGTWVNMDNVAYIQVREHLSNVHFVKAVFVGNHDDFINEVVISTHSTDLEAELALNEIMPPTD
jgi:hypothetical protein